MRFLVLLAACSATAASVSAASFTFSESWIESVVSTRDPCSEPPCPVFRDEVVSNSTTFNANLPIAGIDSSTFDIFTPFSLVIGDWRLNHVVSDDPNFVPGVRALTFIDAYQDNLGRRIVLGQVNVRWTSTNMTISGYDRALVSSLVTGDYVENAGPFRGTTLAEVTLGTATFQRTLYFSGSTAIRRVVYGTGDTAEEFFLSTVTASGSADYTRPAVTINFPLAGRRWSNDVINVRGTARDNRVVESVSVRVNEGDFQAASGTTNWNADVTLQPGTNVIAVKAIDGEDNESALALTRVVRVVVSPISLAVQPAGSGRVTPLQNGQLLEVGRQYTVQAWPIGNYLFSGWTGDVVSNAAWLRFAMQSNLTLVANFVPNPFLPLAGPFQGLFYPTNGVDEVTLTNSGSARVTLGVLGGFSGQLVRRSAIYSFSGKFDLSGRARAVATLAGARPLTLELQLDFTGGSEAINGTVTDGVWSAAVQTRWTKAPVAPSSAAGRYTMVFPGDAMPAMAPGGAGSAAVVVQANHALVFNGTLGDGTGLYRTGTLTRSGHWPIYALPYGGRGMIIGWLEIHDRTPPLDVTASDLHWLKLPIAGATRYPSGFHTVISGLGTRYTAPAAGQPMLNWTDGFVTFTGGNLDSPLTNMISLSTNRVITSGNPNQLSVVLSPGNGIFTGSFRHPFTGRLTSFKGAVVQELGRGSGWFGGSNQTGTVTIEPAAR